MSSQSLGPVIPLKLHLAFGDSMAPPSIQGLRSSRGCRENPPWDIPAGPLRRRECRPTLPAGGVGGTGGGPVSHGWLLGTQDLSPAGPRPRRHPGSLRQAYPAVFPGSLQGTGPPKEERPRRPTPAPSFPQCALRGHRAEQPLRTRKLPKDRQEGFLGLRASKRQVGLLALSHPCWSHLIAHPFPTPRPAG